ncbi:lipoprotein N-acyltransferase Lnb domain-containing protein [Polaribacter sargassicola]|uniref:lipoprotein N-acyltransferase Lnb domain-containing protein n=1 Tax=Polaribacter sargassicola TaxID=2836891 RepID=UPI001F3440ED|nr:DUF4105 domain-containing protein [Polaribacter sp. DS7-9]MCG1036620.1 DUF4105 domain-containing protein [Polaribacter sp. DS7-9]
MKKKYFFLLFLISVYSPLKAQLQLSKYAEVSIITAGPGEELYEAFGHSAIRVKDPVLNFDLIYNYGMFDFNQPNFYTNFAKGNMIYSLARYDFKYFIASYRRDKRWLKEQVLNLNKQEKQAFFVFLEDNALPENSEYLYDPFFDNCATKLRDITELILGNKVTFNEDNLEEKQTLRQLTNNEIHWNTWGSFGLNLIAGTILDKKATFKQYMFLPDYVYLSFKDASLFIKNQPDKLIKQENNLLKFKEKEPKISVSNPLLIFILIAILVIFVTIKDIKKNKRTKYLDFILFFISGLIGCVLLFLWLFSTHSTAPNNFNILWAFGPNFIVAFLLLKTQPPKWLKSYLLFLTLLLISIPFLWIAKVQQFPIVLLPIIILLFFRYYFLSKKLLTFKK